MTAPELLARIESATKGDLAGVGRDMEAARAALGSEYAAVKDAYYARRAALGGKQIPTDLGMQPLRPRKVPPPPEDRIVTLSRGEYDATDRVNYSTLKQIGRSPAQYAHAKANRSADNDAFRFGRVVHLAILEPDRYTREVAVWDGGRRAGKAWDDFCAANEGCELVKQEEHDEAMALASAVRSDPHAAPFVNNGTAEVSILWRANAPASEDMPAASAVPCKSRIDYVGQSALVDVKSTRDASPDGFGRQAWKLHYLAQAAFYSDAYLAATGKRLPFVFIAVEKAPPYIVQVYRVPDDLLELGRREYHDWLRMLAYCQREQRWPGYFDGVTDLVPPRWAMPNDEEDISDLGLAFGGDDEAA